MAEPWNGPLVEIRLSVEKWDDRGIELAVWVDGERVGGGVVGGEPEDNNIYRDYKWIVPLLHELSLRLGAAVEYGTLADDE